MNPMNTPYTPGPYHVQQSDAGTIDVCKTSDGIRSRICRLHVECLAEEHGGSVMGNANLLASAPTLLAQRDELRDVLRALVRSLDNKEGFIDANTDRIRMAAFEFDLQQARAALSKAKGVA